MFIDTVIERCSRLCHSKNAYSWSGCFGSLSISAAYPWDLRYRRSHVHSRPITRTENYMIFRMFQKFHHGDNNNPRMVTQRARDNSELRYSWESVSCLCIYCTVSSFALLPTCILSGISFTGSNII